MRDLISQYFLIPIGKTYSKRQYIKARTYQHYLETAQFRPFEELKGSQDSMIRTMVQYAYDNVPYYGELFRREGISPLDINGKEDLKLIPFLTKDIILRNLQQLTSVKVRRSRLKLGSSGGTTGTPISFYRDQSSEYRIDASNSRFYNYCGYKPGMRLAMLWGNENDLLSSKSLYGKCRDIMNNEILLNAFNLSDEGMRHYIDVIKQTKPKYWRGYSSAVYAFTRYMKRNNIDIPLPKAVIITADKIDDLQAIELNDFFNKAVFNEYGCQEFSILGFECEAHEGIHIAMENTVVEIVPSAIEDDYGEVVVTSLTNWGMPFIRYKLGDSSKFIDGHCKCGRSLPRVKSIRGRITDFVITKTGNLIHGELFSHLLYGSNGIEHFQVLQREIGRVTIYLQKNEFLDEGELKLLSTRMHEMTHGDLDAEICLVPEIAKYRSGKRRPVVSEIAQHYLT